MRENRIRGWKVLLTVCILVLVFGIQANAAGRITVSSCQIDQSGTQVIVRARAQSKISSSDGKYYLFALQPYEKEVKAGMIPAAEAKKGKNLIYRCPLNKGTADSRLYKKFLVAVKSGGRYRAVSDAGYITNPEQIAGYRYKYPKVSSKKGLQTDDLMSTRQMEKDVRELGVKHVVMSLNLSDFVLPKSEQSPQYGIPYKYNGKTYYFSRGACFARDEKVRALDGQNTVLSFVIVLQNTRTARELVTPAARGDSRAAYAGLNTADREGVEYVSAMMSFLGEHYMGGNGSRARVVNWILGNEVDYYGFYNYMGERSLSSYAKAYADSYRLVSTALRSVYSNARVYISLTNCWNVNQPDGRSFTARQTLDAFAKALKTEGSIPWNLAYHAYPQPLTDAKFWDDMATDSISTQYITMKNLRVLTDYVTDKYGKNVHILLSEQGFTSSSGESIQAAAMAYAYYIAEANSRIDAFVLQRHQDHEAEEAQGLYLGLKDGKGRKKKAWKVFQYMDTREAKKRTQSLAGLAGLSGFEGGIPGFRYARFGKQISQGSTGGAVNLNKGWIRAYSRRVKSSSKTVTAYINMARANAYQGIGKSFTKKISFQKKSRLKCKVRITGLNGKKALLKIQFRSGRKLYEQQVKVPAGISRTVKVSAGGWKYKGSVTGIRILVKPDQGGSWKEGGKVSVSGIVQY